jgi:hypothetical protein
MQRMTQEWQLINLQIKIQPEAIADVYTTVLEIISPVTQSIQTTNLVLKEINENTADDNEQQ